MKPAWALPTTMPEPCAVAATEPPIAPRAEPATHVVRAITTKIARRLTTMPPVSSAWRCRLRPCLSLSARLTEKLTIVQSPSIFCRVYCPLLLNTKRWDPSTPLAWNFTMPITEAGTFLGSTSTSVFTVDAMGRIVSRPLTSVPAVRSSSCCSASARASAEKTCSASS